MSLRIPVAFTNTFTPTFLGPFNLLSITGGCPRWACRDCELPDWALPAAIFSGERFQKIRKGICDLKNAHISLYFSSIHPKCLKE